MNILIVDDQPDVVAGVKAGIRWEELPINEIFHAYSMKEAQAVLRKESVQIALCDIEMPMGSGLELFSWMQEHFPEIRCIFLTSHADFGYAQRALKLGGFDYLVSPAPYEEISASILRAAMQIEMEKKKGEKIAYGQYVSEYEAALANTILREYLTGLEEAPEKMLRYFQMASLDFSESSMCVLVHFQAYKKEAVAEKLEGELLRFIIQNVLQELAALRGFQILPCWLGSDFFSVLFFGEELERKEIRECMEEFIAAAKTKIHLHIFACISEKTAFRNVAEKQKRCSEYMRQRVNRYDGVAEIDVRQKQGESVYRAPDFALCEMKLKAKEYKEAQELLLAYIEKLSLDRHLNRKILSYFQQDLLQLFFAILHQNSVSAHAAFRQNYDIELLYQSAESTEEMRHLVCFCIEYLKELEETGTNASPVKRACAYIQKNIHENITRNDIVKEVYVNADYLSRIFKKEMNISLKDYIISEKLKLAAAMLSNTELSISVIAVNTGFTNFSYFTQVFKKFYDMSPSEYREAKRRQGQKS